MSSRNHMLEIAMELSSLVRGAGRAIDVAGVLVIVAGISISAVLAFSSKESASGYKGFRKNVGRSILLGLELLVAGDIIRTVALEPTMQSVLVLAMIVVIRTFLSLALQVELEGTWPWRNARGDSTNGGSSNPDKRPACTS